MSKEIHLVTGASGFIGRELVKRLLENKKTVWVLLRSDKGSLWEQDQKKVKYLRVVTGDITKINLGLSSELVKQLSRKEVKVWHLAANLSFQKSETDDVLRTNWMGTKQVIKLVNKWKGELYYMSTAYVGSSQGQAKEEFVTKPKKFNNTYEYSKYLAEMEIKNRCRTRWIIFRPSIVLGHAYEGKAKGCTFGYYRFVFIVNLLKTWLAASYFTGFILPYPKFCKVNLIDLDYVVHTMLAIVKKNESNRKIFHLINPQPPEYLWCLKILLNDLGLTGIHHRGLSSRWFNFWFKIFLFLTKRSRINKYMKSLNWYLPYIVDQYNFEFKNVTAAGLKSPRKFTESDFRKINKYAKSLIG